MLRKLLLLLVPVLLAFGCAGQGTYAGNTPYVGSFSGTWTCPANGHTGTMTLSISPHATIVGTYVDTTSNVSGQISGNVAQSGAFRASVVMAAGGTQSMTGQFSITSPGSAGAILAGNATVGAQAITFTLPADTSPGTSPYAGSFTGNWTSASTGHYGTMTVTVSTGSNMQGAIEDAVAGTTGSINGSVTSTGSFTAAVSYPTGAGTMTGQLSINNGTLSGNGNLIAGASSQTLSFTLASAGTSTSSYAGSFTGTWHSATEGHNGQISWTISPQATILGTFIDATSGQAGSISGTVNTTGAFTTRITISSSTSYSFSGNVTLTGTNMAGNGSLVNGSSQTITFSLPATPTISTYQGTFSGKWGPSAYTYPMVWTVGPNGSIVGLFYSPAGVEYTLSGSVDANGNYTAQISNGAALEYTIGGQMTYQVVTPPPALDEANYGQEVGEGTITASGASPTPFAFQIDGTINNVTGGVRHKPAATPAIRRR
jgi:hypothetical protein